MELVYPTPAAEGDEYKALKTPSSCMTHLIPSLAAESKLKQDEIICGLTLHLNLLPKSGS